MSFPTSFADKVFAITGAAAGIGLATTHYLAQRGASLSITDWNEKSLAEAEKTLKSAYPQIHVLATVLDVRDEVAVKNWVDTTKKTFGSINGAVNLAGVLAHKEVVDLTRDDWDLVIGVNLTGVFNCLKAQLAVISDGGSIVNAASRAGLQGTAKAGAYCASKFAVIGLTKSVAKEVGGRGIRVNCVCPGLVNTQMAAGYQGIHVDQAIKRRAEPEEISGLIGYLLGDESRFVTGSAISIDGGWN